MLPTTKRLSHLKPLAIRLRGQGKTYSEIQKEIGSVSKSTLTGWLRGIELSDAQKDRIQKIVTESGQRGRQIGAWRNQQKRKERLIVIKQKAEVDYETYVNDPIFIPGLVLYLAEGSKKFERFQFMNSDPYLIKLMINWILLVSNLQPSELRFRLYIHQLYAHENCEKFWVNALRVEETQLLKTIYKPTGRSHKKNPSYKGCLRIEVAGSELYWKTLGWRDCLYKTIG